MFLREPQGYEIAGGGARGFGRALVPVSQLGAAGRLRAQLLRIDWAPDLGTQIGSRDWWRGLLTMTGLMAAGWMLAPGFQPLPGAVPAALSGDEWAEARTLAIAPLGRGADTGRRMAAGDLVRPLAEIPERPEVELTATVGDGDAFTSVLQRAGIGENEAEDVAAMVSGASSLGDIRPGTRIDLTLGRRPNRMVARPLEKLAFRARFDLNLEVARSGAGALALVQHPIAIDHTPLRIQGLVGPGLYRAARAAGAPARAVEDYIKAMASRISIGQDVASNDRFDLVIEQARAATGEVQLGRLLFAGLDHAGGKQLQLVRWQEDGREDWFDARGQIEHQGTMGLPVAGHVTSTFGWRMHPILGTMRMHKGMDIGAGFGSPIYAAMDGVVQMAGWAGGYGNFVKLGHAGALQTGYGHMSRMAVRLGEHVRRGQVIGYVGSTGLSTGPHLHWEVWKSGVSIDPRRISFNTITTLSGEAMRAFKARVASLLAVKGR